MIIKDMRNQSHTEIWNYCKQYSAPVYCENGTSYTEHETRDYDITRCKDMAISDNAVCMVILNYGIHWYYPNN